MARRRKRGGKEDGSRIKDERGKIKDENKASGAEPAALHNCRSIKKLLPPCGEAAVVGAMLKLPGADYSGGI
jgi:hypothetical protein